MPVPPITIAMLAILLVASGCAAHARSDTRTEPRFGFTRTFEAHRTQPALPDNDDNASPVDDSEAGLFRQLDETFGRKGEVKDGVYRLVTPRPDLSVTMDGMDVPTGAFLESDFRFWRCPCGKALVNGQFVVADYEANDVVNELQLGQLHVASLAPAMLDERPRLLLIRFQGEGRPRQLARALKSALSYTGPARNAPQPADLSPPVDQ
jgi:hypothetical protein